MGYERPVISRDQLHQYLLDLYRICLVGNAEPNDQTPDVRVYNHSLVYAKRVAEDDVCRFAADARKTNKLGHGVGHFAAVNLDNSRRHSEQTLRFVTEEPGAANHLLEP